MKAESIDDASQFISLLRQWKTWWMAVFDCGWNNVHIRRQRVQTGNAHWQNRWFWISLRGDQRTHGQDFPASWGYYTGYFARFMNEMGGMCYPCRLIRSLTKSGTRLNVYSDIWRNVVVWRLVMINLLYDTMPSLKSHAFAICLKTRTYIFRHCLVLGSWTSPLYLK